MRALRCLSFQLIENRDGHVMGKTVMKFDQSLSPCIATYSGPNIVFGQAIVENGFMLYQALQTNGKLSAGKASVSYLKASEDRAAEMILNWRWLTGDRSKGTSRWKQLN